jgi:hypothetical protein
MNTNGIKILILINPINIAVIIDVTTEKTGFCDIKKIAAETITITEPILAYSTNLSFFKINHA